jgi:hypothetical protein
MHVGKL